MHEASSSGEGRVAEAALGAVANAGPSWLRTANFGVFSSLVYMWMFPDDKLETARLGARSRKAMLIDFGFKNFQWPAGNA